MIDIVLLVLIVLFIAVIKYYPINPKPRPMSNTDSTDLAIYRYNKHQYLNSPEWKTKRKAALKEANYECKMCGAETDLHIHHISYQNLFREHPQDLVAVCGACLTLIHNKYGYPRSLQDYENFYGPPIKLY